ncbi:MAG: hypothetical protein NVS3B3_05930 [Aquirhabdus sp.]
MAIMDDDEYMDGLPPQDPPTQSDKLPSSSAATSIAMDPQTVQSKTPQAILDYFNQKKQALADAQQETRDNQEGTGLTSALVQLGHGISRAPGSADLSAVNSMAKNDDQPLKNLAQQDQLEGSDPETPQAQQLRKVYAPILTKAGIDPSALDGLGADQIKSYVQSPLEVQDRMMTSQTNRQLMVDGQNQRNEMMRDRLDANQGNKQNLADQKTGIELQGKLDSSGARAGNFGKAGALTMAADRVNAILSQFPDGNIPKAQTEELATATAAMIGGGSVQSQNQLNAIVPQSLAGNANAMIGWLTNDPRGLQQQAFIKNLKDSAERERGVAQQQMNDIKVQRLSAYNDYANRNPEAFNRIIKGAGLDPNNYDMKSGQYKNPARDPQSNSGGQLAASPIKPPVTQNGHTYNWNAQTGKYE